MVLQDLGRLFYNGVDFGENGYYSSSVRMNPIMDDAGRTVVYTEFVVSVRTHITAPQAGNTTDLTLTDIRRRLEQPGGVLSFRSKGLGDISVNRNDVWDAAWGPHPKLISFIPIGDNMAALVEFQVITRIPDTCPNATTRFGIAALNFSHALDFDIDGYATITTTGYVEIPMTRKSVNDRTLPDHVDRTLEEITPPVPLGFQRKSNTVRSPDARRMDFQFIDTQLVTPYPRFVTQAKISHGMGSSMKKGFRLWEGELSGNVIMAAGYLKSQSYFVFMSLVQQRLISTFTSLPPSPTGGPGFVTSAFSLASQAALPGGGPAHWIMFDEVSARDDIFGRGTDFALKYRYFLVSNIFDVLQKSGFWKPVSDTWAQWRTSMNETVNRPRGYIGWKVNQAADTIIDLCLRKPRALANTPTGTVAGVRDVNDPPAAVQATLRTLRVLPEKSWISYDAWVLYREDEPGRFARHKPMGGQTKEGTSQQVDAVGNFFSVRQSTGGNTASAFATIPDNLHEVRSPSVRILLTGTAQRLGHKIPLPRLVRVGGVDAKLNRIVVNAERVVSVYLNVPIYESVWALEYLLEKPPEGPLPVSANPFLGTNGG